MNSQDFDRYAKIKAMKGQIAQTWIDAFEKHICPGLSPDARVLDYGFGDGRYYEFYLRHFEADNIHGVEPSQIRTQNARKRGWQHAIYLPLHQPLPYADRTFDFVNMVEVIEHIPRGKIAFYLKEISRVLKPGAHLLITTPNYPIKRLYDVLDAVALRQWSRLLDDPTHVTRYNAKRLTHTLTPFFSRIELSPYKRGRFYRTNQERHRWHKLLAVCS